MIKRFGVRTKPHKVIGRFRSLSRKKKIAVLTLVLVLLLAMGFGLFQIFKSEPKNTEVQSITYSTDQPDENKPGDDFEWQGGLNDPKFIRLPSIESEGYVQNVGVDQNTQVAVPNNVHMAGWFTETVVPGDKGLSIIDGHVTGRTTDGIFIRLESLKPGDQFSVEFGDGRTKTFEVMTVESVPEKESAALLFSQDPKTSNQLNLITCGGEFDAATEQYKNRVIVASKLIE